MKQKMQILSKISQKISEFHQKIVNFAKRSLISSKETRTKPGQKIGKRQKLLQKIFFLNLKFCQKKCESHQKDCKKHMNFVKRLYNTHEFHQKIV